MPLIVLPEFSMTETLFGGLLISLILFFGARAIRLSGFWAGIVSGALPFLSYLYYSQQHWAGGDVLTIHFAVFLASGGLLMVFAGMQDKKQSMHWGPKVIVSFFIILVLLNAMFLSISTRGLPDALVRWILPNPEQQQVHTAFPGLVPHDKNQLYQPHLQQIEKQRQLGWKLDTSALKAIQLGIKQPIVFKLQDAQDQAVTHANITLGLWRMANSMDDKKLQFDEISPGVYQSQLELQQEGRWIADINVQRGENSLHQQQAVFVEGKP
jgi:nitrogen fixation protein FixH